MRRYRIFSGVVAFGLLAVCSQDLASQVSEVQELETAAASAKPPSAPAEELAPIAALIVSQTNEFRKSEQLNPVAVDSDLTAAAQYFANYIARTDRYGHTADGKRPADRATEHAYEYCIVSENIAYQYSSAGFKNGELATKLVEGWKNSPGHRRNMLEPFVVETGVAVAQSANTGYYYAVQMFGRPKSSSIEFSIENKSDQTIEYTIEERTFPLPPLAKRTHTRCRPPEVHMMFGEKNATQTLKPEGGHSYQVVLEKGKLRAVLQ